MSKILLALQAGLGIITSAAGNMELIKCDSALESANYISTHLEELNEIRRKSGYEEKVFLSTKSAVEIRKDDSSEQGYLVDFDGNKGYVLVGENSQVYDYAYEGNIETKNQKVIFECGKGYSYIKGDEKCFIKTPTIQKNLNKNTASPNTVNPPSEPYFGIQIFEPRTYVEEKYGTNITNIVSNSIAAANEHMECFCADDYAAYRFRTDSIKYGESHQMFATYVLSSFLSKRDGFSDHEYVEYDVTKEEPEVYAKFYDSADIYCYRTYMIVPNFYKTYRLKMMELFNYTFRGWDYDDICKNFSIMMQQCFGRNYTLIRHNNDIGSYFDVLKEQTALNNPTLCRLYQINSYDNIFFPTSGYKQYEVKNGWWVFETTTTVCLMQIRDCLYNAPVYIDYYDTLSESEYEGVYFTLS